MVLEVNELVELKLVKELILAYLPVSTIARTICDYWHLEIVICYIDDLPEILL